MQFHGSLNRAGTTMRVDAALLVGEPGQRPHSLYLARRDTASVTEVTILEVVAAIAGGDTRLRLSTGDVFHLPAGADKSALRSFFPRGAQRSAGLSRLESVKWRGAVVLAVLFLGLIVGIRYSIAPFGDLAARFVPAHLVERGSTMVLAQLDVQLFEESALPDETRARIQRDFDQLLTFAPAEFQNTRLHFRSSSLIGPNAFALPGNDIVLLDELVTYVEDDDVVFAVLAHELGHVTGRHALRQVMRSAVVAIGVSLIVGAEESILEEIIGFGGGLVLSGQSRAFEIEADIASREWLVATGRDPRALVSFFEKLAEDCGVMCDGGGFLDSHPSFDMRIEQIRD